MTFRLRDGLSIGDQSVITYDGELIGNDFYYENTLPSVAPTLNLNFLTKKLDPRITFTRESTASYYDGKTTTLAEQNLLTHSQNFSQWSTGAATITANSTTAPDGTTTAYTITDTTSSASHFIKQTYYALIDVPYTISAYLKAGTSNYALLAYWDSSTANRGFSAEFNLSTGVVSRTFVTSTSTYLSSSITSVGNGWYRCSVTGIVSDASTSSGMGIFVSDGIAAGNSYGSLQYTGTGALSIYAWGAQLEQRSTVSPYIATTTSTVTNYIPVLKTAAANTPRFDHDPITGECKGLLIEESRTNLLPNSSAIGSWTQVRTTTTSDTIIAPDGTLSADKLQETTVTANSFYAYQSVSLVSGTTYTFSFYAKAAERNFVWVRLYGTGTWGGVSFNLTTGATNYTQGITQSSTSTYVGNGWWRFTVTATSDLTGVNTPRIYVENDINAAGYDGIAGYGVYIWGAQLEVGTFATSYIPTTTAAVTRSADNARITGTNFSSWYNKDEGTLFTESQYFGPNSVDATTTGIVTLSGGQSNNFISVVARTDNNSSRIYYAPYTSLIYGSGSYPINKFAKFAGVYKNLDLAFSKDGSLLTNNTTSISNITPFDRLVIGAYYLEGSRRLNGHIKSIKYYPKRLTNAELQAITL